MELDETTDGKESFPAGVLIVRLADGIKVLLIESWGFFCPTEILCSRMSEILPFCYLLLTIMHHKESAMSNRIH